MEKFNNNLKQFIEIIKTNYPEQSDLIDNYYVFDENTNDKYLQEFIGICKNIGNDISTKNEIIFSEGSIVLPNIDFYSIWNDENLTDEQKENIWKYLQTLYIFAFEHIRDTDFKSIMKELKKIGSDTSNLDEETQTFINIIESLTNKYSKEDGKEEINEETDDGPSFPTPDLFGGVIGDLAKEIVNEIDPNELNIENPSEILNSLLSGNFDENNDKSGIVNLVKNITGKIQDKITSGSLNEEQLFGEAQKVMKNFSKGGIPGMGKGMPNMAGMSEMFSTMMNSGMMGEMDEESKNIVNQASNIINNKGATNINPGKLQSQAKLKTTRDRLRKKLEEKKKILEEKKKSLENNTPQDIDLDSLAKEIENIGNNKENKKHKKK